MHRCVQQKIGESMITCSKREQRQVDICPFIFMDAYGNDVEVTISSPVITKCKTTGPVVL